MRGATAVGMEAVTTARWLRGGHALTPADRRRLADLLLRAGAVCAGRTPAPGAPVDPAEAIDAAIELARRAGWMGVELQQAIDAALDRPPPIRDGR